MAINGQQWQMAVWETSAQRNAFYKTKKLIQNDLAFWRRYGAGIFGSASFCKTAFGWAKFYSLFAFFALFRSQ